MLGTPFYLMEHVKGRIFADPSLPGVEPSDRARIYEVSGLTLDWLTVLVRSPGRHGIASTLF